MEVYAGFAEHTDYEIGRLINALEDMGELNNTLFIYSAEITVQVQKADLKAHLMK